MKKYACCPQKFQITEEHSLYVKLIQIAAPGRGGVISIRVPAQFWPRFVIDEEWQDSMVGKYGRHYYTDEYPAKIVFVCGREFKDTGGKSTTGAIPDDEPFAITKYPHCPAGFSKLIENDDFVKMSCWYMDGTDGAYLTIPAVLWDKFTTDVKWPDLMVIKYGRLQELDYAPPEKLATFTEKERNKTGVVPESEL